MGFQKPNRMAEVTFEGSEFEGAEVKATRNVTFAQMFSLDDIDDPEQFKAKVDEFVRDMVVSWNLVNDDGTPTDLTGDALLDNWPFDFVMLLIGTWRKAIFGPPAPLAGPSQNGSAETDPSLVELSTPN